MEPRSDISLTENYFSYIVKINSVTVKYPVYEISCR